jgi:hypothetical protein
MSSEILAALSGRTRYYVVLTRSTYRSKSEGARIASKYQHTSTSDSQSFSSSVYLLETRLRAPVIGEVRGRLLLLLGILLCKSSSLSLSSPLLPSPFALSSPPFLSLGKAHEANVITIASFKSPSQSQYSIKRA